ncbi:hypothetical protein HZH68_011244 [Vespula germanica]|uniref:Large ribosomal subunit protein mL50 n=1 Tax=Vespula germanica TaxID=30212 RepID=A0A834JNE1_VESGE|nr:hypothetical protein HZH68_011244 [Vespula germanica]
MKNMAALIRHASYGIPFKSTSALFAVTTTTNARRDVARFASKLSSANDAFKQNPKLEATRKSLSAKGIDVLTPRVVEVYKRQGGLRWFLDAHVQAIKVLAIFLRPIKPYDPPSDVNERIDKICASQQISTGDEAKLEGGLSRFKIFAACAEEFKHSVPNSLLCIIETVGDLKEFYHTRVDTATPLETLRRMQLPKNLHVQYEYHRFHPDTDTMFGGKTAFPLSSTLVTGLKYKKKYKGFKLEDPFYQEYKRLK